MESEIIYKVSKSDLTEIFKEIISTEIEENVYKRFSNRLITTKSACEILGISRVTLYGYVADGRLKPINLNERNYQFDLYELLKTDIRKFSKSSNRRFRIMKE